MELKLIFLFFAAAAALKCRNGGIHHETVLGREFCECSGHYWGDSCELEDVSRGSKVGCRYLYLNAKNVTHWLIDTNVRKDYKCWVFYGRTQTPEEFQRIGVRVRQARPGIDVAPPPTVDLSEIACDNNVTAPESDGKCIVNGTVVYDASEAPPKDANEWELFWWQWEQIHGTDGFKGSPKDPKKRKNFFFFKEHFSMLRRDEMEFTIENAFMGMKAREAPVEMFFESDIVTMIYRETENVKADASQYKFSTWTDLDECGAGIHNCDVLYGECINTQFGFECECKKGSVTRKGAAKGTNCQLECHVALVELPTFDIDEKIRKVQAELDHFIFNLTETDRQLREGIVTFRDNMIAQKLYTMNKLETFREQEYFTDNLTIAEIVEHEDKLNLFINEIAGKAKNELVRYNENMDALYKENKKLEAQDQQFMNKVQAKKFDSDMKFARDINGMRNVIEETNNYMTELSRNITLNNLGLTPSEEATTAKLADFESSWRGGISDLTSDIADIDKELENQFNSVVASISNLKNKIGARLSFTMKSDTRRQQWRNALVNMSGAKTSRLTLQDGGFSIRFDTAGYYYMVIHAKVSPNAKFQWKNPATGDTIGEEMGLSDFNRSGEDIISEMQIVPFSRCDRIQLEVQSGALRAGSTIVIARLRTQFEGAYFGVCS